MSIVALANQRPSPASHALSIQQTIKLNAKLNAEAQAKVDSQEPRFSIWDDEEDDLPNGMGKLSVTEASGSEKNGDDKKGLPVQNGREKAIDEKRTLPRKEQYPHGGVGMSSGSPGSWSYYTKWIRNGTLLTNKASRFAGLKKSFGIKSTAATNPAIGTSAHRTQAPPSL